MLDALFHDLRGYLDYFFDSIDLNEAKKVEKLLLACPGTIFLSGVGKSGHIAQKIAATFISTGTRAAFLSPGHALHGDIGLVLPQDVFLLLSKSGESEELLQLLPAIKNKQATTIAVVSSPRSRLALACDTFIHLPVQRELCPYDLAPTTSTAAQLIFGDCLAIALMHAKRFTISEFASNHPAGLLGRKITLKVSDLMLKGDAIPVCRREDRLIDVLHALTAKRCGCLLIEEEGILQGIFTDGDLRRSIEAKGEKALQIPIGILMSSSPRTIAPDQLALAALRQMEEDPSRLITVLPVVEEGRIAGLLRMHDILQAGLR